MSSTRKNSSIPGNNVSPNNHSGIERNQLGDFKKPFDFSAKVMNQELPRPFHFRAASCNSSPGGSSPNCFSKESRVGSVAANSPIIPLIARDYGLSKLEGMQYADQKKFDAAGKEPTEPEKAKEEPYPVHTSELKWTGRNLLDLGANLQGNASMYQPAALPQGVHGYFENRSQISRVNGARPPPHKTENCPFLGCDFETQCFYE